MCLCTRLLAPPFTHGVACYTVRTVLGGRVGKTLYEKICKQLYYKKYMFIENKVYPGKFVFLCFFSSKDFLLLLCRLALL